MSSTSTFERGVAAAGAKAIAYLAKIGMLPALEYGMARLLEKSPSPSSAWEAWVVLSAEITQSIKAQDGGGESKDDAAEELLSVFVATKVRSE